MKVFYNIWLKVKKMTIYKQEIIKPLVFGIQEDLEKYKRKEYFYISRKGK